jgi:hypothetical protein
MVDLHARWIFKKIAGSIAGSFYAGAGLFNL